MKLRSLHIDSETTWKRSRTSIFDPLHVVLEKANDLLKGLDTFLYNEFIFSPRYHLWRHLIYWSFHIMIWSVFWMIMNSGTVPFSRIMFNLSLWAPIWILFGYPMAYWAVPQLLIKGKIVQFLFVVLAWGVAGLYINAGYRIYIHEPIQAAMGFDFVPRKGFQPNSSLCMTTSAASPMIFKFFKLWTFKQREWMATQQEKITAELQLLKAQVHPHFLFNTLNNIYTFSIDNSPKTPSLILKLSSLLSYMLYDCNGDQVRLEKEVEVMKNYIDLESERYGSKSEVSWSVDGNIKDSFISPLLMLPFLENAFKHGMADGVSRPWLSVDLSVKADVLRCKIANSKNEFVRYDKSACGEGVRNVERRLAFMYPDSYELKTHDEGNFFVVSLLVRLTGFRQRPLISRLPSEAPQTVVS
ncbi:MAG TPA: histidine kinase [Chryseolinea sp.]|nr:histidine kinase [Chryseolinea sp.]